MARENQGLQIALMIFVGLTVLLGIGTFFFYRNWQDATVKAKQATEQNGQSTQALRAKQDECNHLKQILGFADTDNVEAIDQAHAEDMQKYAANFAEEKRYYRPVLEYLYGVINEKNGQLIEAQLQLQEIKTKNEMLEAAKDPQIAEHKQAADSASTDLAGERAKFNQDRAQLTQQKEQLAVLLDQSKKAHETEIDGVKTQLADKEQKLGRAVLMYTVVKKERDGMVEESFETAQGEIRWVNQQNRVVWINLGRADGLERRTTFSVYDADSTGVDGEGKKGSIEISEVLGEHLAEGRIIDDVISNPIQPGDLIHTPVWSPGSRKHFVLAGFIDIDGDGVSDLEQVHRLIELNGGVVDAPMNAQGKRTGAVTVQTRYMVVGKRPDPASSPEMIQDFSEIESKAQEFHIEQISLDELLRRMGWKDTAPSLEDGVGSGRPQDDMFPQSKVRQPVSNGRVSDIFEDRRPPVAK